MVLKYIFAVQTHKYVQPILYNIMYGTRFVDVSSMLSGLHIIFLKEIILFSIKINVTKHIRKEAGINI